MNVKTLVGDVKVTRTHAGFITGFFESGDFKGQRAISNDGVVFLPAGEFVAADGLEAMHSIFIKRGDE